MKQTSDFSKYISSFLNHYLIHERGASNNTIKSYSYTFLLFINYMHDVKNIQVEKLTLSHITKPVIVEFLDWLQSKRNCSNNTRNQRLSAISSFIKYVQYMDPSTLYESRQILSIPLKKTEGHIITYLTTSGIELLLKQPDVSKNKGIRDLALLSLMYESAARVQEIIDLTPSSLFIRTTPYRVELYGKGNKYRTVPLPQKEVQILLAYMTRYQLLNSENAQRPLFQNAQGQKMTRNGINNILIRNAKMAKGKNEILIPAGLSCHSIRHSKAMGLLESKVQLIHIRDFLGHKSVLTTEIYARMNSQYTFEAIKNAYKNITTEELPIWKDNDRVLTMLKGLVK